MSTKMKVVDLFCGAGGSSMGLKLAGFDEIVGIDINEQLEYPFMFLKDDVFNLSPDWIKQFDFIWVSPPCQAYTWGTRKGRENKFPDLIAKTRRLLLKTKKPFVIENVCSAPIRKDLILCGPMFGLRIIRNRAFEIHGFKVSPPALFKEIKIGTIKEGNYITVAGHGGDNKAGNFTLKTWQKAMGIDWITDKKMIAEAVPPAYAKYIGEEFLKK